MIIYNFWASMVITMVMHYKFSELFLQNVFSSQKEKKTLIKNASFSS